MAPNRTIVFALQQADVIHIMHYADHCDLYSRERQMVSYVRAAMFELLSQRDAYSAVRRGFRTNSFTGLVDPTPVQEAAYFHVTVRFFRQFYATLGAWAGLMARLAVRMKLNEPSTKSMSQFIDWLGGTSRLPPLDKVRIDTLRAARNFRALVDHPGQFPPFEWDLHTDEAGFVERVRLYGGPRGTIPPGAHAGDGPLGAEGGWSFLAPGIFDVTNAMGALMSHLMPSERASCGSMTSRA